MGPGEDRRRGITGKNDEKASMQVVICCSRRVCALCGYVPVAKQLRTLRTLRTLRENDRPAAAHELESLREREKPRQCL